MKLKILLLSLTLFSTFQACKQTPKTPQEIAQQELEEKSDEQIIEELYGYPLNYQVKSVNATRGFSEADPEGVGVREGGIVQVLFNKGQVYIKGFGTLSGSYQSKYYANPSGTIVAKFVDAPGPIGDKPMATQGKRYNPKWESMYIQIVCNYKVVHNFITHDVKVVYLIRKMNQ
jgi:hypothetical protein